MSKRLSRTVIGAVIFAGLFAPAVTSQSLRGQSATPEAESSPAAAPSADAQSAKGAEIEKILKNLNFQQGTVTLSGGLAKLTLPPNFRYLNPEDAEKVLHDIWGNPPRQDVLGLLMPADVSPVEAASWAVVIDYQEEGYIKDDEADSINYNDLMSKMKEGTREMNKTRVAEGYPAVELLGWATPPRYDKATKKMYWAKQLKVDGADENTLNYNIRILGRRGVLVLNAIGAMSQLPEIEKATPTILSMVDFNQGHRYADFDAKTDKVAAYGIGALVLGGIAAKAGLFKVLLVGLLAAKKFVIIGVVAIASWVRKLFKAGREDRA